MWALEAVAMGRMLKLKAPWEDSIVLPKGKIWCSDILFMF